MKEQKTGTTQSGVPLADNQNSLNAGHRDDDLAQRILSYLRKRTPVMIDCLTQLVSAESPSTVPQSQEAVLSMLADRLGRMHYQVSRLKGRNCGGHLYARPRRRNRGSVQLLLGHCDTVWPVGTLRDMPVTVSDGRLSGPGSYDMKAGLVQMLEALEVLQAFDLEPPLIPLVFINSDEEIGSRESTRHIRRLARLAERVMVLEPSLGLRGKLKTARKGVGRFTVTVKGKAAHAGLNPESGASAILELSYVIQKLFALNDPQSGTSVNVGIIEGGIASNVIAAEARASVDVRVLTSEDARRIEQSIVALTPVTPGVRLEIEGRFTRSPMERTPANDNLWLVAREIGQTIGLDLDQTLAGGGSDGNTTSLYTATLDGMGAVGDGAHAHHEFVFCDLMAERSALLALLLLAPSIRRY
jgi:glutamate carboxypeptidase